MLLFFLLTLHKLPSEKSSNDGTTPQFELTDESRAILKRSCPNLLGQL
jgi:hypothetical protein